MKIRLMLKQTVKETVRYAIRYAIINWIADHPVCKEQLISGRTGVADSRLTSSSSYDSLHLPSRSRLEIIGRDGLSGAWKAADGDYNPWIKVISVSI